MVFAGRAGHGLLLGITRLEVGLAVEVDGLDVGNSGRVAGGEEDHVTGDALVGEYLEDLADSDLLPSLGEESAGLRVEHRGSAVVLDAVRSVAAPVLVGVLDGGDEEDEREGESRGAAAEDSELGELVEDDNGEEVDVGQAAELLEQVAGEEGNG